MKMIMMLSIMLSFMFTKINHPMMMGLIMLIQTMMISMLSGIMHQTFWFSYTLFLIFIGGMMVLFIYVTSLASNEMFLLSTKLFMMMLSSIIPTMLLMKNFNYQINNQETTNYMIINNYMMDNLMKLYNKPTNMITLMMASYLFLTLIVVIKITNIFMGPLRQMN